MVLKMLKEIVILRYLVSKGEKEAREKMSCNDKAVGRDRFTEKIIKSGCEVMLVRFENSAIAFDCLMVPEDWETVVSAALYKSKEERIKYKNYKAIILY